MVTTAERAILAVCPSGSRTIQYAGVPLSRSSLVPALTSQLRSPVARRSHVVGDVTKTLGSRRRAASRTSAAAQGSSRDSHARRCASAGPGTTTCAQAPDTESTRTRSPRTSCESARPLSARRCVRVMRGQPAPDAHRLQQSGCIHRPRRGRAVPERRHRDSDRRGARATAGCVAAVAGATAGRAVVAGVPWRRRRWCQLDGKQREDQPCKDEPKRWRLSSAQSRSRPSR